MGLWITTWLGAFFWLWLLWWILYMIMFRMFLFAVGLRHEWQDGSVVWMWMGYDGLVDKMRTLVSFVSGGLEVGGWIVD